MLPGYNIRSQTSASKTSPSPPLCAPHSRNAACVAQEALCSVLRGTYRHSSPFLQPLWDVAVTEASLPPLSHSSGIGAAGTWRLSHLEASCDANSLLKFARSPRPAAQTPGTDQKHNAPADKRDLARCNNTFSTSIYLLFLENTVLHLSFIQITRGWELFRRLVFDTPSVHFWQRYIM